MRIKEFMTKKVITVSPETKVLDAQQIMEEKHIRRLPVVEGGKLVGIVTKSDLTESTACRSTPLGPSELQYVLSSIVVKDVMKKNPVTVTPDTPFEEALRLGQKKKIGAFPVVEKGELVGITTESDIVRFLIRALGIGSEGSRISVSGIEKRLGQIEKIVEIIGENKIAILSMIVAPRQGEAEWIAALRLNTNNPEPIIQELKKEGFDAV
ncbi:MAG TPA: CBS and ACT domain-containing protein [Acidobacteriota bacterium]|nr:CBS and ACT domain-containing protein [Acidobacteriota bacterium]